MHDAGAAACFKNEMPSIQRKLPSDKVLITNSY